MKPYTTMSTILLVILRTYRQELGLKQSDVAEKIGIAASGYSKIESGESVMRIDTLMSICAALENLSVARLLTLAENYLIFLRGRGWSAHLVGYEVQDDTLMRRALAFWKGKSFMPNQHPSILNGISYNDTGRPRLHPVFEFTTN